MKIQKFKLSRVAAAVMFAAAAPLSIDLAHAGAGVASSTDSTGAPIAVPTYYANSPAGTWTDWTGAVHNSGTALRKFVDTLPGVTAAGANNLIQAHGAGQYIPVAAADTASYPGSDYYEIGIVEYTEKLHRDLPKATTLRGYVQLETAANAAVSKHVPLTYPDGTPIKNALGVQILAVDNPHYLGPLIAATRGKPVRVKYSNLLPKGHFANGKRNGDLFLPVDKTLMGAGTGSNGGTETYTENRAELHLHGGDNVWISDGTPHQWTVPAGETTSYKKGVSFQNVPDMPDPGDGSGTLYWTNGDSARLMFYHDHASGITRLNVYGGEAAGYLLTDPVEATLPIPGATLADLAHEIPLVIQEKTFVPADIAQQDAKWDTTHWGQPGDLWFPHVYETNQDPNSFDATNPPGRWDWGPWFWPVFPSANNLPTGAYGDVTTTPEAFMDTPIVNGAAYPTLTVNPQAYRLRILSAANDRSINLGLYVADPLAIGVTNPGSGYTTAPVVTITPAAGDVSGTTATAIATVTAGAITSIATTVTGTGFTAPPTVAIAAPAAGVTATAMASVNTEVKMIAANPSTQPLCSADTTTPTGWPTGAGTTCWPDMWPTDGRDGGVPDPLSIGPKIVQIGNEAGLLPASVEIPSTPVGYEYNRRSITVLNVFTHGLYLAPAERADAIVDFSQFAGKTLILYNDSPAPVPGFDPRIDYYTGNPDLTAVGGAPSTLPGYGPNTRTIMQIKVAATAPAAPYNTAALATALPAAYAASQPKPIVAQAAYNTAFGANWANTYAKIFTGANYLGKYQALTFVTPEAITYKAATATTTAATAPTTTTTAAAGSSVSAWVESKAIQELFEPAYGRMNATLGVELPFTTATVQTTIPLAYIDPTTETIADGETQFWKITHNGVDTHPVHFHLVNVQVINRVGWDGTVKPPEDNEFGWKETVKMNPLEDIIIAVRAKAPKVPFGVPTSLRYLDPTQPAGSAMGFTQIDPVTGVPAVVTNVMANFGWEYVWHCHILGHEENDFMRPLVLNVPAGIIPSAPRLNTVLSSVAVPSSAVLTWTDPTPAATSIGNPANEIGFNIQRAALGLNGIPGVYSVIGTAPANATTYTDTTAGGGSYSYRLVAFNTAGTSAASNAMTVMLPPAIPTGLTATPNMTSVALKWKDNANNETSYQVLRNSMVIATLAANSTSYTNTGLVANTTYSYTVQAVSAAGVSASTPVSVKTLAAATITITAPGSLTAMVASATQINLSWTDLSINERSFAVWRSVNGGAATQVGTVNRSTTQGSATGGAVSFSNTGLVAGRTYTYYVTAISTAGQISASSNTVSVLTAVPAAPSGLSVTAARIGTGTTDSATLRWTDTSNNETGFTIQRATNTGFTAGLTTATAAANATTITQTGLARAVTYYFRVRAVNAIGNSGWSNVVSVRTP